MGHCATCGAPFERVVKWNSGNPQKFDLPTCDCEAEAAFDDFFTALERRRDEDAGERMERILDDEAHDDPGHEVW